MRVAHEAPLSIIRKVQQYTDYDYALVHLFEESFDYYQFFQEAVDRGRYVILDNSIFELGTAFDMDNFATYVEELKPSAYIVPDVLEDCQGTIDNFKEWNSKYKDLPGKKMGVVQGKDWNEIQRCYQYMNQHADIIGISFDYSWYESEYPDEPTKYHSWMKGRQQLLAQMLEDGIINTGKPHHLLGAGLPQEFAYYKHWSWIDTIDTSNPVVHGIKGIRYQRQPEYDIYGLDNKESVKLYTMMEESVANEEDIFYNINMFRHNISER
jgi:hypothetical protein